ncbi:MAG: hypothetical protein F9K40_01495 [Kofleriaceae bacterium]|nr:MAG: hypothetical protein F9K40_01495 [Kofleriaceae bacterium]MBZ0238048.1 tetratricopeptide repeat protein [Kofleriaceae bacterium]
MHKRTLGIVTLGAIFATAAMAIAPNHAAAQKTRYTRTTSVKVDVKLSERTKPKPKKDTTPQGPSVTADMVLELEGAVGDIRKEQIQLLETLIEDTPDSDVAEKADLFFRLGQTHAQMSRYHRLKAVENTIKADTAKKDKAKFQNAAKQHKKSSEDALKNAVRTYKRLADNEKFKSYPRMDQALFAFAYTLQQGKYMKEARQIYHRLLTEYPQSKYVPDAYLAFADYYFQENQLANAEAFYKKVLLFPKSNVYSYSNYMLGWVYLNLTRHEEAGKQFLAVIRDTEGVKKQETLNRASKKDFVRAFSEFGNVTKAWQTFNKIDDKYAFTMFELLADFYTEQGKSDKSIYVYRALIKEAPKHKNVCLWQYNIATAMLSAPGASNASKVEEIERLVKLYGALDGKKILPPAEASECHDNAAAMSGEMARAYHNESIKTKNPETLAYADKLYNVYLEVFPNAPDYGDTQYYYSELLWSRADSETNPRMQTELWENAAVSFTNVVKTGKVDQKLLKESAYAAVLGWKNALAVDPRVKVAPLEFKDDGKEQKVPEPQPIPEREKKMLDAFDIYINYIKDPNDEELVGMKFLKANMYRRYNHFDEALPLFEDIIKKHAKHETAYYSANIIIDIHIIRNENVKVAEWAKWVMDNPKFISAKEDQDRTDLQERAGSIMAVAERKILEQVEAEAKKTGDYAKYVQCGNGYLKLFNDTVKKNPDVGVEEKMDQVLYNAGVCFEEGRSLSAAISVYVELMDRFPSSKQSARALARLGNVYARVAYYDKASANFEEYAKKYAKEDDAYKAMNDAVFYRKGIGDDDKAIENTKTFISKFGSGKKGQADAASAFFSLASIYEKRGDLNVVVDHYRAYIKKYGSVGGGDRLVAAYGRIGQILWQQSCPVKTVDGSCIKIARERAVGKASKKRRKGDVTRTQCGPETKIKLTVVTRDAKKAKEAMKAFGQAISEFERKGGKFPGGDERTARYWYALSKFYNAEDDYEKFLSIKFPEKLNFDPAKKAEAEKSLKRFDSWFKEKEKLGGAAAGQYSKLIFDIKEPQNAIAGAARIGQVSQNFSDALYTAEIPENIRKYEEAVDIYCETLEAKAEPLENTSLDAFSACLKTSTDFGWFSSWSKLCERELGQIKPEDFPTASELRAEPGSGEVPVRDVEPAILKVE